LTRGLSLAETIMEIHEQGGLVNIPHPFTRIAHRRPRLNFMERFAGDIDAVEVYNARNSFIQDDRLALDFARRHNLGRSAGSDAHFRNEIGRGYVLLEEFEGRDSFLQSLKGAVPAGRKTPPAVPLVNWLRHFPGAWADMRLQYRLTGRP
jgi:predicted metal-dependent phosphoesterase TrpH